MDNKYSFPVGNDLNYKKLILSRVYRSHSCMLISWKKHMEVTDHGKGVDTDMGFPGGSDGKESVCNAGDPGSMHGSGSREGNG